MNKFIVVAVVGLVSLAPAAGMAAQDDDPGAETRKAEAAAQHATDRPSVGNAIRAGDAAEKAGDAFASDHDKKVAREQAEKDAKKGK